MKAEHEAESTDRISTREELCEVIDLLCETGGENSTAPSGKKSGRRQAERTRTSADLLLSDLGYEFEEQSDDEAGEQIDDLSATLSDLFSSEAS